MYIMSIIHIFGIVIGSWAKYGEYISFILGSRAGGRKKVGDLW